MIGLPRSARTLPPAAGVDGDSSVRRLAIRLLFESRRFTPRRAAVVALASSLVSGGASLFWLSPGRALAVGFITAALVPLVLLLNRTRQRHRMARQARSLVGSAPAPTLLSAHQWLPPAGQEHVRARRREGSREPDLLGRIDNDGRILSACGNLPGFDRVDRTTFGERYRYGLDLVMVDDADLIRKDYRGDRDAFLREWLCLAVLGETSCSPVCHHVDEQQLRLFKSYVPGSTLRQLLVESGARILTTQTDSDPQLTGLSPVRRMEAVWARGREHFDAAFGPDLLSQLKLRLDAIHRRGVTGFSLSFGNVVLEETTGLPWFIDFDAAHAHRRSQALTFLQARDRDRELFGRIYGLSETISRSVAPPAEDRTPQAT